MILMLCLLQNFNPHKDFCIAIGYLLKMVFIFKEYIPFGLLGLKLVQIKANLIKMHGFSYCFSYYFYAELLGMIYQTLDSIFTHVDLYKNSADFSPFCSHCFLGLHRIRIYPSSHVISNSILYTSSATLYAIYGIC